MARGKKKGLKASSKARVTRQQPPTSAAAPAPPQPRRILTKLDRLTPFLKLRILGYLTETEREPMYVLDPRIKPTPQQVQMMQKRKEALAKAQAKMQAEKEEQEQKEPELVEEASSDTKAKQEKKTEEETKTEEPKKPQPTGPSLADPATLLARLNTRRLLKRMRYFRKNQPDAEVYAKGKTTHEIAMQEWEQLLQNAREKKPDTIPSPYELLLFSPCPRSVSALASYPRSGNSLMRNLFERTTLRVTGSDMRGGLTQHDLVGEAAVGANCVQFVKTHYPERRGQPPFKASRIVLLVRNPYDAIESHFNLMMTGTHTTSIDEEQRSKFNQAWEEFALKEIQVWKRFHEYWLNQKVPTILVRYEDLIRQPDQVMAKVVQFVLEIRNMNFFESRIDRCIREEQIEQLGSYRPRSGGIGKSLSKYSAELVARINAEAGSTMKKLGYAEMLAKPKEEWQLEPLPGYAVERVGVNTHVVVNGGPMLRVPELRTDWHKIKLEMAGETKKCMCYSCINQR